MDNLNFLDFLIKQCKKQRITLILSSKMDKGCTGFFTHIDRELEVFINRPESEWVPDAVHEWCHVTQWMENLPLFWKAGEYGLVEDEKNWPKYDPKTLKIALDLYRELEYDCESRAVSFIKKHKLNIDLDLYCQKSNACLYYYGMIHNTGWKESPCNYSELVSKMPTELKRCKKIPQDVRKLFSKYYDF